MLYYRVVADRNGPETFPRSQLQVFVLFLIFLEPLVYNPWGDNVFILPKTAYLEFFILTLACLFFVRGAQSGQVPFPRAAFSLPVVVFAFSQMISCALSVHPPVSRNEFSLYLALFFLFAFIQTFQTTMFRRLLQVLVWCAVLVSLYALLQRLRIDFVTWNNPAVYLRPAATTGNPTFLGAYLACVFPLTFFFAVTSKTAGTTLFYGAAAWMLGIALFLTFSRGGWLAAFSGALIFFLFCPRETLAENKKRVLYISLFLGISFFALNYFRIPVEGRTVSAFERATSVSPSVLVRFHIWKDALYLFKEFFWFGSGQDTFAVVYPKHRSLEVLRIQAVTALPENAHNEFLQTAVTSGIFGFFSYVWLLLYFLAKIKFKCKKDALASALAGAFVAYMVQSLFNPKTLDTHFLFWILLGMGLREDEDKEERFLSFSGLPLHLRAAGALLLCGLCLHLFVPKVTKPVVSDFFIRKANDESIQSHVEKALINFYKALDYHPENPLLHRTLAIFYKRLGETAGKTEFLEYALQELSQALDLSPYDASLYADTGRVYASYFMLSGKKKYASAGEYFHKQAVSRDPLHAVFHNDLGILYLNEKNFEKAEESFQTAVRLVPNFGEPYLNLGKMYYFQRNMAQAIHFTLKSLHYAPEDLDALMSLATYFKETKRYHEALSCLTRARKVYPFNRSVRKLFFEIKDLAKNDK